MVDFVALVTPPILVGPNGEPAQGKIYAHTTNTFALPGVLVVPYSAQGLIKDGAFTKLDGSPYLLPVTPEGGAIELVAEIFQDVPGGQRTKHYIRRTVATPNASTVTWDALTDVVPVAEGGDYVLPSWAASLDAKATEAIAAAEQVALDRAATETAAAEAAAFGGTNNTQVAGMVTVDGPTKEALTATVAAQIEEAIADIPAPVGRSISAARTIVDGDSLMESSSPGANFFGASILHAAFQSKGSLTPIWNAAHGGYTSAQLQALFVSEVIAKNPTLVVLAPGRNDDPNTDPTGTASLVRFALAECRKIGAELVLLNATPQGQAAIPAPTVKAQASVGTGTGTLPNATHRYKVTATTTAGETTPSEVVEVTTGSTAQNARVTIEAGHVPGANGYRFYKETTPGSGVYGFLMAKTGGSIPYYAEHSWTDQGNLTPSTVEPPTVNTTAMPLSRQASAAKRNAWLAKFAAENGLVLVDIYSRLVDGATGMWKVGYTYDGTHPNGESNAVIGEALWDALAGIVKQSRPIIALSGVDPLNLFPAFPTTGTRPAGTTIVTSPSWEASLNIEALTARPGFIGGAYTVGRGFGGTITTTSAVAGTGAISVGDELALAVMLETEDVALSGGRAQVSFVTQSGGTVRRLSMMGADYGPVPMSWDYVVEAGVTGVKLELLVQGTCKLHVGQVTVYNKTTQTYLNL